MYLLKFHVAKPAVHVKQEGGLPNDQSSKSTQGQLTASVTTPQSSPGGVARGGVAGGTGLGGGVGPQQSVQGKVKKPQDEPKPDSSSTGCWQDTPLNHFRAGGGKTYYSLAQLQRSGLSATGAAHPLATAMAKPDCQEEESAGQFIDRRLSSVQCKSSYLKVTKFAGTNV